MFTEKKHNFVLCSRSDEILSAFSKEWWWRDEIKRVVPTVYLNWNQAAAEEDIAHSFKASFRRISSQGAAK